jgi:hypothetical protein
MRSAAHSAKALITVPGRCYIRTMPSSRRLLLRLAALALIAVLMCTGAPVSAAESAVITTQQVNSQAPEAVSAVLAPVRTPSGESSTARLGPMPQTPARPTKRTRRRHHFWFWHLVPGSGGPLSWLLVVPYLILGGGLAAILIFVRRRRAKGSTAVNFYGTQGMQGMQAGNFDAPSHAILDTPTDIHRVDDRLQRLQDLHAAGMLSDDEFQTQRLRILGT